MICWCPKSYRVDIIIIHAHNEIHLVLLYTTAVRHIACSLVLLASPNEISDANIKKQITVSPPSRFLYLCSLYALHIDFYNVLIAAKNLIWWFGDLPLCMMITVFT